MKSIIQEASSIAKAVEQAWIHAGQPAEFTIKVLEMPQKNFLGFTTRPAKVAFFFDIPSALKTTTQAQKPKLRPAKQSVPVRAPQAPVIAKTPEEKQPIKARPIPVRREYKPLWNPAMIAYVQEWIQEVLKTMNLSHITFTIEPSNFHLRIIFDQKLLSEDVQEKKLFASFACLIIESLKRTFKTGFRGHKIVLLHTPHHDTQS